MVFGAFGGVFSAGPAALRFPLNFGSPGARGRVRRAGRTSALGGGDLNRVRIPQMARGARRWFTTTGYIGTIGRMARRAETIELAVLGLLHEGPMHGYELRKRLNLMLGWGRVLSYGSLYPTLKKMLRGALIEETATATVSRRPRIVYQLTDAGHREFERLM